MSGFRGVRAETAAGTYITNEAALYFLDSRPEQAIAVYREAVEADPSDPRPYYQMGKAYASLGLTRESTQMFEKAASVNPVYRPFSLMSTGITLLKQGAYGEAAAYLKQAVTLDPSLAIGHYNLGLALFSLGRQAEAREALAQAVRTSGGNSEVALSSAQILIELGDLDQAVALAQAVLEREPRNGQAFYTLGLAFERQGNVPQAIAQYETALEFMPSPEIRQKLVQLRTEQLQR
jgi:tetratricopeptide (TPR) repeat protein